MRISIIAFDGFSEIDTFVTLGILNQMRGDGWRADLVCAGPKITSVNGIVVASQRPLEWANESDVVLIGASARMREVTADGKLLGRLNLDPGQQLLGVQCNAALLLSALDALPDREVCAEQPSMAWLIQAGLKPMAAPLRAVGNVATAGGRLAASYLAAWVIWRLDSDMAARHALYRVAPAGEEEAFIAHVLGVVRPFIDGAAAMTPEETESWSPAVAVAAPTWEAPSARGDDDWAGAQAAAAAAPWVEADTEAADETGAAVEPIRWAGFEESEAVFGGRLRRVGKVASVQPLLGGTLRVMVVSETFDLALVEVGDNVLVNGLCVAVTAKTERSFKFDLAADLADALTGLDTPGGEVNLERRLRPGQRAIGHLLRGRIDGVGEVIQLTPMASGLRALVQVDRAHARLIADGGCIALNGIALTTSAVKDVQDRCVFAVELNPPTLETTTLGRLQVGGRVNVELDAVAYGLEAMLPTTTPRRS